MSRKFAKYKLSKPYLREIRIKSDERPILKGSHRGAMANYIGCIGMYYFNEWVKHLAKSKTSIDNGITNLKSKIVDVVNFDVLVEFDYEGKSYSFMVEIKTKDRNVRPRSDYEVSVPCKTYKYQIPDYYFAISLEREDKKILDSFRDIYFLGFISRNGYDRNKYEEAAGKKVNGANFFCPTWNIKIEALIEANKFPTGMVE